MNMYRKMCMNVYMNMRINLFVARDKDKDINININTTIKINHFVAAVRIESN
jgi:hypothetical protein